MDGEPPAGRRPGLCHLNERIERLEFHLSAVCTARCVFCSEADRMRAFRASRGRAGDVHAAIRRWAHRGLGAVHFTGGEPTLHPELPALLALCRRLGLRTGIGTNGHRLADPRYRARVGPLLDEVMVSLHGPAANVHDRLVGRGGSFRRALAAIEGLAAANNGLVAVNVVATRHTVNTVGATVARAVDAGARFVLVSQVAPEGAALLDYGTLAVPNERVMGLAAQAVTAARGVTLRFFGFPACLLGDARWLSNDLYFGPRVTVEWADSAAGPHLVDIVSLRPDRGRAPVDACDGCAWSGACPGPFEPHARVFGTGGIAALGVSTRGT